MQSQSSMTDRQNKRAEERDALQVRETESVFLQPENETLLNWVMVCQIQSTIYEHETPGPVCFIHTGTKGLFLFPVPLPVKPYGKKLCHSFFCK